MINRKLTKKIRVGNIFIGGDAPIPVQTMIKSDAHDVDAVVKEILRTEDVGCEITRMGVLDMESVKNFSKIKKQIHIPIVADIHFDYRLAIEAIKQGVDKLRINPGNIGDISNVKKVVNLAKERGVPIRIGVNAGSLEKDILEKNNGHATAAGLVESASRHIKILEDLNFDQTIVSLKASDIAMTVEAYNLFSQKYDYPLHIGITEAGTNWSGTIKSSIGIGSLLLDGIGDTLRVSLTADPTLEVRTGWEILKNLEIRDRGPRLISCPTCSRTQYDLFALVKQVEEYLATLDKSIKVAVMGCVVNGPGEAREADVGVAGGKDCGILFSKGKILKTIPESDMFFELKKLIEQF
ncbi:MAG: flavodoxin-dependent (E)-4-hydroxy-3-methylbut-2-enyl-diphosphate synthase [Candidatus Shapirobacteria bacterium]